jgi:excisionase family DNA binding protein
MLTVPEAARRVQKNPETVRRWIREGKLPATKVGTQHVIDEADLERVGHGTEAKMTPVPKEWRRTATGEPMPNAVAAIWSAREGR